jgi:hypothetical protein
VTGLARGRRQKETPHGAQFHLAAGRNGRERDIDTAIGGENSDEIDRADGFSLHVGYCRAPEAAISIRRCAERDIVGSAAQT